MNFSVADIQQSGSVLADCNPAVEQERKALERRALDALLKWAALNPIERAFSFELEEAARGLLSFRGRHEPLEK